MADGGEFPKIYVALNFFLLFYCYVQLLLKAVIITGPKVITEESSVGILQWGSTVGVSGPIQWGSRVFDYKI